MMLLRREPLADLLGHPAGERVAVVLGVEGVLLVHDAGPLGRLHQLDELLALVFRHPGDDLLLGLLPRRDQLGRATSSANTATFMKRRIEGTTWLGFSIQVGWLASQFSMVRHPYSSRNSRKAVSHAVPGSESSMLGEQLLVVRDLVEERLEPQLLGFGPQVEHLAVGLQDLVVVPGHEVVEEAVVAVDARQFLAHLLEHLVDLAVGQEPHHVQVAGPAVEPDPLVEGVRQLEVLAVLDVDGLGLLVQGHHLVDTLVVLAPEVLDPRRDALVELDPALGALLFGGEDGAVVDPAVLELAVEAPAFGHGEVLVPVLQPDVVVVVLEHPEVERAWGSAKSPCGRRIQTL